ncbi:MAG: hypothetical protein HYV17_10105 [Xanthomonadales bacterium]|nr:hypothetical protein [Xanthomonadales bacterium]
MKTSIDIDQALLERARKRAQRDRVTIKHLVETGLRLALREPVVDRSAPPFVWPSAGTGLSQPLGTWTVNEMIDATREQEASRR